MEIDQLVAAEMLSRMRRAGIGEEDMEAARRISSGESDVDKLLNDA